MLGGFKPLSGCKFPRLFLACCPVVIPDVSRSFRLAWFMMEILCCRIGLLRGIDFGCETTCRSERFPFCWLFYVLLFLVSSNLSKLNLTFLWGVTSFRDVIPSLPSISDLINPFCLTVPCDFMFDYSSNSFLELICVMRPLNVFRCASYKFASFPP